VDAQATYMDAGEEDIVESKITIHKSANVDKSTTKGDGNQDG